MTDQCSKRSFGLMAWFRNSDVVAWIIGLVALAGLGALVYSSVVGGYYVAIIIVVAVLAVLNWAIRTQLRRGSLWGP